MKTWIDRVDKAWLIWKGTFGDCRPRHCFQCNKKTTGFVKDVREGGHSSPLCQDCARKKGLT